MSATTTVIGDRRRQAYERAAARRHHPARRARRQAAFGPPPAAFYWIAGVVFALVMIGLVMVLSASSITSFHVGASPWRFFTKQLCWAGLGLVALGVAFRTPIHWWRHLATPLLVASLGLMALPFLPGVGVEVNSTKAWVAFGPVGFQPSEVLKLSLLLWCADRLVRRSTQLEDLRAAYWPCTWVLVLGAGMAALQGDLGSAVVIAAIVITVMFIGGVPLAPLALGSAGLATAALGFIVSSPRRLSRWTAFMDLEGTRDYEGYQVYQAIVSIANGGPTGVGVGAGTGKWGYVPLAHSDFIFAIIAEELGMVGVVAVLGGFALLTFYGVQVALAAKDQFGTLLAGGIVAWLFVQTVINVGGVTGSLPVTGLTLPFISFGGTSLLVSMAAAGLLLNVARYQR